MRHFIVKATAAAALAAASLAAHAVDGTITISGTVVSNTCAVAVNGGTASATVALPPVSRTALASATQTAATTPFTLNITGCGAATPITTPYFEPASGGSSAIANGRLVNQGTATNVDVQVLNSAGNPVTLGAAFGSQNVPSVTVSSGTATHNLFARYYATGAATAGSVTTTLAYTIVYQ